jgi:hypothetical protein
MIHATSIQMSFYLLCIWMCMVIRPCRKWWVFKGPFTRYFPSRRSLNMVTGSQSEVSMETFGNDSLLNWSPLPKWWRSWHPGMIIPLDAWYSIQPCVKDVCPVVGGYNNVAIFTQYQLCNIVVSWVVDNLGKWRQGFQSWYNYKNVGKDWNTTLMQTWCGQLKERR